MRRCPSCGGFFKGDECPNTQHHEPDDVLLPPLPELVQPSSFVGQPVTIPYSGASRIGIIASEPDEQGEVAVMLMTENVRILLSDVEVIT